jgi:hypothetical protein
MEQTIGAHVEIIFVVKCSMSDQAQVLSHVSLVLQAVQAGCKGREVHNKVKHLSLSKKVNEQEPELTTSRKETAFAQRRR